MGQWKDRPSTSQPVINLSLSLTIEIEILFMKK
jgi:hypothetical protein